ncbi:unnamed protein product [Hydatigera taeniaeformis]|uniref:Transporter n=1 Tax=Hydatigena taeniaeformis TaxID=6205 RepID=A0A0R3WY47_HYDTA|nr:unnamed protein product [Hydatigera taeniaeformis]
MKGCRIDTAQVFEDRIERGYYRLDLVFIAGLLNTVGVQSTAAMKLLTGSSEFAHQTSSICTSS